MIDHPKVYIPKPGAPALPPQLSELANQSTDEFMKTLNRMPLFMTEIDETDGEGGENVHLEALKSLAYDGEPDEIATNFKNQGNDCFKSKDFKNAIEYYNKALDINCNIDSIDAACYGNRAACNLELKNYRRCINDCKECLKLEPKNIKAIYRTGKAFFKIDKINESIQILQYGLSIDEKNLAILKLLKEIGERKLKLDKLIADKKKREDDEKLRKEILINALKVRNIINFKRIQNDYDDDEHNVPAKLRLEDPKDIESQLIFPTFILYPTVDQSDFINNFSELDTPLSYLNMCFEQQPKWFEDDESYSIDFKISNLECYAVTTKGSLIKIGKKVIINKLFQNEKISIRLVDGMFTIYVVPKNKAVEWIAKEKNVLLQNKETLIPTNPE